MPLFSRLALFAFLAALLPALLPPAPARALRGGDRPVKEPPTAGRGPLFQRGDATGDGAVDVTDAIATLNFLFAAREEPGCLKALDADDNGEIELTDANYTINFLFLGGPSLPLPRGACGLDPTPDDLTCASFETCGEEGPRDGIPQRPDVVTKK